MRTLRSYSQLKAKLREHTGPESRLQEERLPHSEDATTRQSKSSKWLHRAARCWPSGAHELSMGSTPSLIVSGILPITCCFINVISYSPGRS